MIWFVLVHLFHCIAVAWGQQTCGDNRIYGLAWLGLMATQWWVLVVCHGVYVVLRNVPQGLPDPLSVMVCTSTTVSFNLESRHLESHRCPLLLLPKICTLDALGKIGKTYYWWVSQVSRWCNQTLTTHSSRHTLIFQENPLKWWWGPSWKVSRLGFLQLPNHTDVFVDSPRTHWIFCNHSESAPKAQKQPFIQTQLFTTYFDSSDHSGCSCVEGLWLCIPRNARMCKKLWVPTPCNSTCFCQWSCSILGSSGRADKF